MGRLVFPRSTLYRQLVCLARATATHVALGRFMMSEGVADLVERDDEQQFPDLVTVGNVVVALSDAAEKIGGCTLISSESSRLRARRVCRQASPRIVSSGQRVVISQYRIR